MPSRQRKQPPSTAWMAATLTALLVAGGASAREEEHAEPEPTSAPAIETRRAEVATELAAVTQELRAATPGSARAETLRQHLDLLTSIGSTLDRSLEELRRATQAPPLADTESPPEKSILALGELYQEQSEDEARGRDLERAIEAGREAVRASEEASREAEAERRELQQVGSGRGEPALETARLRARHAREQTVLRALELRSQTAALAELQARLGRRAGAIAALREELRSAGGGEANADAEWVRRQGELIRRREAAESEAASLQLRLDTASARYQALPEPDPVQLESIETLRTAREARVQESSAIQLQLERLEAQRLLSERWTALIRDEVSRPDLRTWEEAAAEAARAYRNLALQKPGRIAELEERRAVLRRRLQEPGLDPSLKPVLTRRSEILSDLISFHADDERELEAQAELARRFVIDAQQALGERPIGERIAELRERAGELWRYEITSVDDEPITIGKLLLALVFLALGFSLSRRASEGLRHVAEARFRLEPGVAGAVQTGTFYLLLVSFTLFSLRIVNFPLTAFTVAGGALAIGLGFGSQNVMNNFISGLILMLERPVRSNDLVEVEGTHGTIDQIGARSTRIRATDGRHLIVPNSFFLENNVVNWTLSDDLIRARVDVGVVYGSPTRLTSQLIQQALEENSSVLRKPDPIIIFSEFGDNALLFEAYFWLRARRPMAVRVVQSEIRFRIDELFRKEQLVIAFPQRDVHLDSVSPIEVRIVADPEQREEK